MTSNYNKYPEIRIKGQDDQCFSGWDEITSRLNSALVTSSEARKVIVVECYQGVDDAEILTALSIGFEPGMVINTCDLMHSADVIEKMTYPDVTSDRIFGFLSRLKMEDFLDAAKVTEAREKLKAAGDTLVLIYGPGAALVEPDPTILVYADMARWEIQLRMRRHEVHNLGLVNAAENIENQYKRGYFVDWRVCDRLKKKLVNCWDFVMDTNVSGQPKMITRQAFNEAMKQAANQPFSVVPYFDAGPWGGQWMKQTFNLDPKLDNYAWCFNCVPEENSLYLLFGDTRFEMPSINVVFTQPRALLGDPVHARFGDEFPIRFDFLDTMGGGNLSLQVHPLTEFIQQNFGIPYTQDESYYLMEAGEEALVYLGLKDDIHPEEMADGLKESELTGKTFEDSKFVNSFPARKHDHFLIPGGTVHCSGKDCMVLEISSTPYIFTFKLWDWGRMGLDGKPRPINIERGLCNIQWDRTTTWVKQNLINRVTELAKGDGWREETTGLHEREFIETRRHWFTKKVEHHTNDGVNVLALVEGDEVTIESPAGAFEPFVAHYAEVFIVPASAGAYTIKPSGPSAGKECATVKAFVRVNA
ncbi:MAG: class I mannose-6-phosphate isomerase [Bacteroidetes bacterium]|nr:class I mannose-6-phosphate isomerase [Bacteroidota bacterium]